MMEGTVLGLYYYFHPLGLDFILFVDSILSLSSYDIKAQGNLYRNAVLLMFTVVCIIHMVFDKDLVRI